MIPVSVFVCRAQSDHPTHDRLTRFADEYAQAAGLPPVTDKIVYGSRGKPAFEDSRIHFSVSHSGEFWACAFSDAPIGLDLQQHKACAMSSITRRFFHPQETDWLQATDYADFFAVWAAKESYVKYTGEGITDAFSAFCVVNNGTISHCNDAAFEYLPFREEYTLCVCTPEAVPVTLIDRT